MIELPADLDQDVVNAVLAHFRPLILAEIDRVTALVAAAKAEALRGAYSNDDRPPDGPAPSGPWRGMTAAECSAAIKERWKARKAAVLYHAREDGFACAVAIPKDPGQAGSWQAQDFVSALSGYNVEVYGQSGSKWERAQPFAAQVNGENVSMIDASWNRDFRDELRGFPNLAHDDQVDAASCAFGSLLNLPRLVREPTWTLAPHMSR